MIRILRVAFEKVKAVVAKWFRPVIVNVVRQVIYIQRPALKAVCRKPRRCALDALRAAGQGELFEV